MGLSDSVICGHIIGEEGLSAVNLMQGVFEVVTFVGMMVTVGTSVLFATELGAMHVRRAKGFFTLGLCSAVAFGLLFAAVLAVVRTPVISAFGASPAVSDMTASYWLWYLPAAALQPVAFFLGTICYTDGDARLSFCSYLAQLLGNCLLSVPLTMAFGAAGCALGTGLGSLSAIVVLLFHFRKRGCMLGWSRHFAISDLLKIFRTSFGDASKNIGKAVLMFALNAYVIAKFGSDMLPVLAVVVMTIGISEMFDGVANAAQPLASVYIGEKNPLLTIRVMRTALWAVLTEGGGVMLLLLAFPSLMLMLVGIDNPEIVPEACFAVRAVSAALLGLAIVLLFNSYYVAAPRDIPAVRISMGGAWRLVRARPVACIGSRPCRPVRAGVRRTQGLPVPPAQGTRGGAARFRPCAGSGGDMRRVCENRGASQGAGNRRQARAEGRASSGRGAYGRPRPKFRKAHRGRSHCRSERRPGARSPRRWRDIRHH